MKNAVVEQFDELVNKGTLADMVAFLKQLPKTEVLAVRARTKQLLRTINWWQSDPVLDRLFLAGLATYSKAEALTRNFALPPNFGYYNARHQLGHQQLFKEVVLHSRPTWLLAWLQREARQQGNQPPPYRLLGELLDAGGLEHDAWLFAQSTANWLSRYNRDGNSHAREFEVHLLRQLQADTTLLTRDLPLLLDFDTPVDSATIYRGKHGADITWLTLLPALVESGHLDRAEWLTRTLLALRRDFRRPLLTWLKNLFLSLKPTPEERLARQSELVELLAHPLPLVVNFALEQLKDLWSNSGFAAGPLLPYAEALLARHDLKTGLRTLLSGLEKLLKRDPTLTAPLAIALTTALATPDATAQERAAKLLAGILGAKKSVLTLTEVEDVQASVALYADLLPAAARATLAPWLAVPAATGPQDTAETYAPQAAFQPELTADTAIAPVADYHEWLFLTGTVLTRDTPTDRERWLEGLLRLRPQFPVDFAHQLLPYLHQVLSWHLDGKNETQVWQQLAAYQTAANSPLSLPLALLASQLPGSVGQRVARVSLAGSDHAKPDPLLRLERQRLAFAERQLAAGPTALPLLSTPTHVPHWLAPTILVQRLLAYQAAGQEPDSADLSIALARCACHAPTEAAAARALLPQLDHTALRELVDWFLAPAGSPQPLPELAQRQSVGQVLGGLLRRLLPIGVGNSSSGPLTEALPWLWAVAARTRYPEATFEELRPLADYPGVAAPWQPGWHFEPVTHVYQQRWNKQQPTRTESWTELRVPTEHPGQQPPSPLLLYSLHARLHQKGSRSYLWSLVGGVNFLLSLVPAHPGPLHWHLVRTLYKTNDTYSEERNVQQQVLHTLLLPGPAFAEPTTLLLALALVQADAPGRALALEVLLAAIEHSRLAPYALGRALGRLLAASFAPVPRLTDNLAQARALGARPDDALCQLLEALLPELPATPPRQTAKLLATYADLVARTRRVVPAAVQARLSEWSASAALKKAATELLGRSPAGRI
ncbi:DUF6493 family protein [Hymenobacter sp. UYP22]|uniref:DUF6493 family protein n=1 Tax=Hymenobacter sp. UYP22 TaxID=3156348 RepID=UPI003397040F